MDPNANLKEQREIAQRILHRQDIFKRDPISDGDEFISQGEYLNDQTEDAERLAELVQALDEWLQKGGFLPADWNRSKEMDPRDRNRTSHGLEFTEKEVLTLVEALDSHIYWQLSEEQYRNDGFVNYPGSDDPEMAHEIKHAKKLHDRLEAIAMRKS